MKWNWRIILSPPWSIFTSNSVFPPGKGVCSKACNPMKIFCSPTNPLQYLISFISFYFILWQIVECRYLICIVLLLLLLVLSFFLFHFFLNTLGLIRWLLIKVLQQKLQRNVFTGDSFPTFYFLLYHLFENR